MSSAAKARDLPSEHDGRRDFDFIFGHWNVRHRRLKTLLCGAQDWYEFPGTSIAQPVLGGLGNIDDNNFPTQGFGGMTLRLFDPAQRAWAIYWANSRTGILFPPVFGRFENGEGRFRGVDEHDGKPIQVTYRWSAIAEHACHWEQAFSVDGKDWETNWHMDFARAG